MDTPKNDAVMCDNQMQAQIKRPKYTELWSYNTLDQKKLADLDTDVTTPKIINLYLFNHQNDRTKIRYNGVEWIQISH